MRINTHNDSRGLKRIFFLGNNNINLVMKNSRAVAVLAVILFSITISADNLSEMPADLAE